MVMYKNEKKLLLKPGVIGEANVQAVFNIFYYPLIGLVGRVFANDLGYLLA